MALANPTSNNNYINPLTPEQRGKFYIAQSDPNNTPIGLAKLAALYGVGNVIVVPDQELLKYVGTDLLSIYSNENFDPLAVANSSYDSSLSSGVNATAPVSGSITLPPPTNLKIDSSKVVTGSGGTNTVSVTVSFDTVAGADSYAIYAILPQAPTTSSVSNVVTSASGSGAIIVTWDAISNASNYVMTATNQSTNASTSIVVTPDSGATRVTGSISGAPSGTYKVYITPYNSNGYAGTMYTSGNITI